MENKEYILSKYNNMRDFKHPLSGKGYSKIERIAAMTSFLTEPYYDNKFSNDDKLLATKCIEMILNEY